MSNGMIRRIGHGERAAILDGGFARWADQGRKTTSSNPSVQPVAFHARVQHDSVTNIKAVKWVVDQSPRCGQDGHTHRFAPARFFRGEEAGDEVTRAGHIPGAVNVP